MTDHIKIIQPGILSTLQDGGRKGYAAIGVGPGGVMDQFAFHTANRLLNNPPGTSVLEMHFPAPMIECHADTTCCLTGADFNACLNDIPLLTWQTFQVKRGDILQFKKKSWGFRGYLAVQVGFIGHQWLGSSSTNMILKTGGCKGRRLQKGDIIALGETNSDHSNREPARISMKDYAEIYDDSQGIVCLPGPEWHQLSDDAQEKIMNGVFVLSMQSNRMACLLENKNQKIEFPKMEMLSSAVIMGTVQLLPNGSLAILMADHQTTGGFPRILQILQSQIPRLSQVSPGGEIRFRMTDQAAAEADFISFVKKCSYAKIN